ncbi:MAG: glycosyltransferase, partial [Bacteroidota bacterium]
MKLPITTITVSCDEGHLLDECLSTLSFCAERIVVDMASTDQTAQVAATHQVRYLFSKRYPVIEYVRAQLLTEARHDWVLFVDPDERIPPLLQTDLLALFEQKKLDKVGI